MSHTMRTIQHPEIELLNRRKYEDVWERLRQLADGEQLVVEIEGTRAIARRLRAAITQMARYRKEFNLITSVSNAGAPTSWLISFIRVSAS